MCVWPGPVWYRPPPSLNRPKAQRWPTISADADAVRKRYAQAYDAAPPLAGNFGTTFTLSADVQYTFDFWGQRAALRAALGETAARDAEVEAARLMLTSRIASARFELSHLFAMRDLAQQSLELRRQTFQLVERRVHAGPIPKWSVSRHRVTSR